MRSGDSKRRLEAVLCSLLLVVAALPGTNWTLAPVDPAVSEGGYALVQVDDGAAGAVAAASLAAGATDVLALEAIDVVTARVTARAVDALRRDARVAFIGADTVVRALDDDGRNRAWKGKSSPGVAVVNAERAWSTATGRGVTVALMDTGVAQHPDLDGSVVARVDFVGDGATQLDPSGHGTFVAGLIAAHGRDFKGVAPDAKIVSLRVLDRDGVGTMHSVLAAFDWLLKNRTAYQIRVLNLSFGAPQSVSYHRQLLSGVVESAHFAGIVVVTAAGNDGPRPGSVATPGSDPFVVTVGSLADKGTKSRGDDRMSSFTGRGPTRDGFLKPDVLAPGERVMSLRVPGTTVDRAIQRRGGDDDDDDDDDDGDRNGRNHLDPAAYARLTGTSASSAMTAGVAALVLQARSAYTPTQVKGALVAGGRSVRGSSAPAVDAFAALTATPIPVNVGVRPSKVLLKMLKESGQVLGGGVSWEGISWEGISWEGISWEGIAWEGIAWEGIAWEGIAWEGIAWEGIAWEGIAWESVTWESVTWEMRS